MAWGLMDGATHPGFFVPGFQGQEREQAEGPQVALHLCQMLHFSDFVPELGSGGGLPLDA